MDVTIVLPCYNEQDHVRVEIERIASAMDSSGLSYELLAIDDRSTDGTLEQLAALAAQTPSLRVIAFRRNGGVGTARRIGTQDARGEIVVWTDADLSYPNERIPELVAYLREHPDVDQVVGARTSEHGSHRVLRVPAKWFIRKTAEFLVSTEIPDLNSGLRAFRRTVALPFMRLLPPGFSCVSTLTLAFLSNQLVVDYLPIEYVRRGGRSKFHPLEGRVPLSVAGPADGHVLQPAEGAHAARAHAVPRRCGQGPVLGPGEAALPPRHQHRAAGLDRVVDRLGRTARRPDREVASGLTNYDAGFAGQPDGTPSGFLATAR